MYDDDDGGGDDDAAQPEEWKLLFPTFNHCYFWLVYV